MIPLNVRSHYSLMWGTSPVGELCAKARQLGYQRLALTDTDNLYGMWPFINACQKEGIIPVIGVELTDPVKPQRAVCLVKDSAGYANLCRLTTRRHTKPGFDLKADLPGFARGLVVLTKDAASLEAWYGHGVDVAAHLPRTPLHKGHDLCRAAARCGVPLVATPGSFFLAPGHFMGHRMLRAIGRRTSLSQLSPVDVAPENAFLASPAGYGRRFAVDPGVIQNSRMIAEKLAFTGPGFGTVMPPLETKGPETALERLTRKTLEGAKKRYGASLSSKVRRRINYELGIIAEKNFCEYFLVVQEIVGISPRTCGRGSGAASIVAYCLGITNVCPVKHNLYFERFLNPGRKDAPDIDIDFAWDERDHVLDTVLERFKGRSAMVSSHILFQPRMAVREVARVFGLPDREIGRVTKGLPWYWRTGEAGPDLLAGIRERPEFRDVDFPESWPEILSYARALTGTPRHLSVHPGGVVITPGPIDSYVPLQTAPKGVPLMQWEKDGAEQAGLVKIDLLGNRSLGVIRDAVTAIEAGTGGFQGFDRDPEDDGATQNTVARGDTMGCFYIESPAMRLLQKRAGKGDFDHVVIHSSIIRPAANEFIRDYVKRLHTRAWEPIHPLLADVLDDTYGIMVYQEDVSRVAVAMAGFSHTEADALRKILSKKEKEQVLNDYRLKFEQGAGERGVCPGDAARVWEMITSFSGYSFCKPHSASYARVSFQAAYLKTHHPAEFMAAVISNQGGFYSTFAYVSEAKRMGVKVAAPHVNHSAIAWTGRGRSLRVGFMAVKELGCNTMEIIVRERQRKRFTTMADFLNRVVPRENEARALILAGALDGIEDGVARSSLLWEVACFQRSREKKRQYSLFGETAPAVKRPDLPPDDPLALLRQEYSVLGFLCKCHPMVLFRQVLKGVTTVKAGVLEQFVNQRITVAGWLITGKVVRTKHGEPMEFLTFEDETATMETTFFPRVYDRFCYLLDHGRPYLLSGIVQSDLGAVTLSVEYVRKLSPV
ncbi:MAG: DNA polymerase III subunit alpha [Desulfobacteraceae bacterium]|nr:DNA polymerase III subunit alpha [Desulfobacteraceae bacterium]